MKWQEVVAIAFVLASLGLTWWSGKVADREHRHLAEWRKKHGR